jgi:tripartite-type tricarboxylate transporter receptor subunit TctC
MLWSAEQKIRGTSVNRPLAISLLCAAALARPGVAAAQDYPAKPIRVIASSAPGGISDIFIRTVGEELTRRWGQPIVIENRVGGGMNIGGRACAEALPDGYTTASCRTRSSPITSISTRTRASTPRRRSRQSPTCSF